ncbi:MAG: hypothetical protein ACK41P_01045 [Asticcacaulis sp.]
MPYLSDRNPFDTLSPGYDHGPSREVLVTPDPGADWPIYGYLIARGEGTVTYLPARNEDADWVTDTVSARFVSLGLVRRIHSVSGPVTLRAGLPV